MQVINNCVVGLRTGMMAQLGARALGRGLIKQWHREVCVKMASTALIFSALQPVRPALHLPHRQQVVPGRLASGNCSNLLLMRQCATAEPSYGANAVLLETRECADGSIMYKFGSPELKDAMSIANEEVIPNAADESGAPAEAQSSDSDSRDLVHRQAAPEHIAENQVETSESLPHTVEQQELSSTEVETTGTEQKLANLELGEQQVSSAKEDDCDNKEDCGPIQVRVNHLDSSPSPGKISEVSSDESKDATNRHFISGAAMIPHPEKAARGGEDAYFIEGSRWIGVADGVGGWALEGINAGHYARELMWHCAELARDCDKDSDPKTLLVKSFSRTKAMGSTTAVVASVSDQTLSVVNMGDTGFLVVRNGEPAARSIPMQRGFNFPYQIGSVGDDPFLAEVYRVPVEKGDIVILGSDGLFDNLFESEIVTIVSKLVQSGSEPEAVAKELANAAHRVGATQEGLSPFAKEAQAVGYSYSGGKMDDITCVVSVVS